MIGSRTRLMYGPGVRLQFITDCQLQLISVATQLTTQNSNWSVTQ